MDEKELDMLIEMKTDIASIKTSLDSIKSANDTANEALQSSKSAHRRLDKVDKIIFWTVTTIIGAVIVALLSSLWVVSH